MKLKYYLRGLGIGIVCTAIIMGIALSGNTKETMTDTEIIERARLLGMLMPEDADELSASEKGQGPQDNEVSNSEEPEDKNIGSSKTKNETDKNQSDNTSASDEKDESDKQDVKQPDQPGGGTTGSDQGMVQIEIKSGDFSDTVSQKLYQAGLVSDAEAFNSYLTQKGADQTLRVGVYQIPIGATQEQIIEILSK